MAIIEVHDLTLRMLLGLVAPTSGRATILGRPYAELAEPLTHVGAGGKRRAFTQDHGPDHLRVLAASAGVTQERVREVLELVDLTRVRPAPGEGLLTS